MWAMAILLSWQLEQAEAIGEFTSVVPAASVAVAVARA